MNKWFVVMQVYPQLANLKVPILFAALSKFADKSITVWFYPPNSKVTLANVGAASFRIY